MASSIANIAYALPQKLGVNAAFGRTSWRQSRLLILCWHGVSIDDEHLWRGGLYIPGSLFRTRLEALQRGGYSVLPLDEAIDRLLAGDLPPKSVALTFDDGLYDFVAVAAPILEQFRYHSTVYLPTYYVDDQKPVPPLMISYVLWKGQGPGRRLSNGMPVTSPSEADAACKRILDEIERDHASAADKDRIASEIAADLGLDDASIRSRRMLYTMTAAEAQNLQRGGLVTFEGHTHRHRTPTDLDLMRRELRDNNRRIEEITGRRPVHFCYPSGVYRREYFPLFEEIGYKSATTCEPALMTRTTNPFLAPRLLDHMGLRQAKYEGWLAGLFAISYPVEERY
jgi:peptidoglycan/xylan/chitin deacetylase (PgdA/CDA1 family)